MGARGSSSFVNIVCVFILFFLSPQSTPKLKQLHAFQATGFELCATVFIRVNIILAVLAWEVCHYRHSAVKHGKTQAAKID